MGRISKLNEIILPYAGLVLELIIPSVLLRLRLNGEEPDPELFTGIFRRLLTDPLEELMEMPNRKRE